MADRPKWHLKYQDPQWSKPRKYVFDPREDLTVGRLRQIKGWFGPELGRYLSFISAFSQGDPEAALCALWIVRSNAGEDGVPEPNNMPDFEMGAFYDHFQAAGAEDPTQEGEPAPTPTSTVTPTSSETATSDI